MQNSKSIHLPLSLAPLAGIVVRDFRSLTQAMLARGVVRKTNKGLVKGAGC